MYTKEQQDILDNIAAIFARSRLRRLKSNTNRIMFKYHVGGILLHEKYPDKFRRIS